MVCWVLTVSEPIIHTAMETFKSNTIAHCLTMLPILLQFYLSRNTSVFLSDKQHLQLTKTRPDVLWFHQHYVFRCSTVTATLHKWNQWRPVWGQGNTAVKNISCAV